MRYKIVVTRYLSEHKSKKEAQAALKAYKLKKGELAVLVDDAKGDK